MVIEYEARLNNIVASPQPSSTLYSPSMTSRRSQAERCIPDRLPSPESNSQVLRIEKLEKEVKKLTRTLNKVLFVVKQYSYSSSNKPVDSEPHKWSRKYDHCIRCGTTRIKHNGHGLCFACYYRRKKDKDKYTAGSDDVVARPLLSKESLYDAYIIGEKSLGEIAAEAHCSRQYVHYMAVSQGIPLRSQSSAMALAADRRKVAKQNADLANKLTPSYFSKVRASDKLPSLPNVLIQRHSGTTDHPSQWTIF